LGDGAFPFAALQIFGLSATPFHREIEEVPIDLRSTLEFLLSFIALLIFDFIGDRVL
jgi:hypothetical protein